MLQKFFDWFKPLPPAAEKITDKAQNKFVLCGCDVNTVPNKAVL